MKTYIERDLRQLITIKDFESFSSDSSNYVPGESVNCLISTAWPNDVGVFPHNSPKTGFSILEAGYIVFSFCSRITAISQSVWSKSPKTVFFMMFGLAAFLLGIEKREANVKGPVAGKSFLKNMVIAEALKFRHNNGKKKAISIFYRDSKGNEVDLLMVYGADIFPRSKLKPV